MTKSGSFGEDERHRRRRGRSPRLRRPPARRRTSAASSAHDRRPRRVDERRTVAEPSAVASEHGPAGRASARGRSSSSRPATYRLMSSTRPKLSWLISRSGISMSNSSSRPTTRLRMAVESSPRSAQRGIVTDRPAHRSRSAAARPTTSLTRALIDARLVVPCRHSTRLRSANAHSNDSPSLRYRSRGVTAMLVGRPPPSAARRSPPGRQGPAPVPGPDRSLPGAARRPRHRRPAVGHQLAVPLPRGATPAWRRRSARRSSTSAATTTAASAWYRAHFELEARPAAAAVRGHPRLSVPPAGAGAGRGRWCPTPGWSCCCATRWPGPGRTTSTW